MEEYRVLGKEGGVYDIDFEKACDCDECDFLYYDFWNIRGLFLAEKSRNKGLIIWIFLGYLDEF